MTAAHRGPTRKALAHTPGALGVPDLVTMPRLPWEPEHVLPDPREETQPRQPIIRNHTAGRRGRRVVGWVQECETGVMDRGEFA